MGNLKMSKKRKSFSNTFKAKVAIEALKGQVLPVFLSVYTFNCLLNLLMNAV